jgi:hypothetical protein
VVEHGRRLGPVLGVTAAAVFGAGFSDAFLDTFFGLLVEIYLILGSVSGILALALLLEHLRETRTVARQGYSRHSVLRAVAVIDADESRMADPLAGPAWSRRPRAVISIGLATTIAGLLLLSRSDFAPASMLGLSLSLFAPAIAVARVARLKGMAGSWWARVVRSRAGGWLWNIATLGVRAPREAAVGGEPTALAVGHAIRAMHAALPDGEQRLLAEVPDLAERLEVRALDRDDPHAAEAMAALETLRLDLMRLRAGQLAANGVTEDLRKLRDVGLYVDARDDIP